MNKVVGVGGYVVTWVTTVITLVGLFGLLSGIIGGKSEVATPSLMLLVIAGVIQPVAKWLRDAPLRHDAAMAGLSSEQLKVIQIEAEKGNPFKRRVTMRRAIMEARITEEEEIRAKVRQRLGTA